MEEPDIRFNKIYKTLVFLEQARLKDEAKLSDQSKMIDSKI